MLALSSAKLLRSVSPPAEAETAELADALPGGSLVTDATSLAEGVATIATCKHIICIIIFLYSPQSVKAIGGKAATVITSAGGAAITLAESGAGVVTTFAGSVYTAATGEIASATNSNNAALGLQAWSPSAPLTGGLATVLVSMVFGAWVAL